VLNLTYPTPFNGAVIIGDTTRNSYGGSADVPPQLTTVAVNGVQTPIAAVLELRSNDGAFVVPRMATADRNALTPLIDGALVFDTDLHRFFVYQTSTWLSVAVGPSVELFTWNNNIILDTVMQPNNGYFTDGAILITMTLPLICNTGDTFIVYGDGTGFFRIAQNANQQIRFNNALTTAGVGGSITSTVVGQDITIVCRNASTDFKVIGSEGAAFNVV
jgi:hypothetical protein